MAAPNPTKVLKAVDGSEVEKWFRRAWKDEPQYPSQTACAQMAVRVNTIVGRQNVPRKEVETSNALRSRRDQLMAAARQARLLEKSLTRIVSDLEDEARSMEGDLLKSVREDVEKHIDVITEALAGVQAFLTLKVQPKAKGHMDPVVWLKLAAQEAWRRVSSTTPTITSDYKPDGPLVSFIRNAFEAIGLAREGEPGYSLDTISEHLRDRHNRPRPERRATRGVGAK